MDDDQNTQVRQLNNEETSDATPAIFVLPDELLVLIMSQLDARNCITMSRVCKKFYELLYDWNELGKNLKKFDPASLVNGAICNSIMAYRLISDDTLLKKIDGYFSLLKICFSWFSVAKMIVENDNSFQEVKDQLSPGQVLELSVHSKVKSASSAVFASELLFDNQVIHKLNNFGGSKRVSLKSIARHYLEITASIINLLQTPKASSNVQLYKMGIRALHVAVFALSKVQYGDVKSESATCVSYMVMLSKLNAQFKFDRDDTVVLKTRYLAASRAKKSRRKAKSQNSNVARLLSDVRERDHLFQKDEGDALLETQVSNVNLTELSQLRDLALSVMSREDVPEFEYARAVFENRPILPDYEAAGLRTDDLEEGSSSSAEVGSNSHHTAVCS